MAKRSFKFLLALVLFLPLTLILSACGGPKAPTKLDRTNEVKINRIYQNSVGEVLIELANVEHEDYELISNSLTSTSMEFSVNNGKWFLTDIIQDYYDDYGKYVYSIAYPKDVQFGDTTINKYAISLEQEISAGSNITISIRIPESDKYKASGAVTSNAYKLKTEFSNINFYPSIIENPDGFSTPYYSDYNYEYGLYLENNKFNVGGFELVEAVDSSDSDESQLKFVKFENLTEQQRAEIIALGLEYKYADYDSKYITTGEETFNGVTSTFEMIGNGIELDENNVLVSQNWIPVSSNCSIELTKMPSKIWSYTGAGKHEVSSLVLLIRSKTTETRLLSEVEQFEYVISYERNILNVKGEYSSVNPDEDMVSNPTASYLTFLNNWMEGGMQETAKNYSGEILIKYKDAVNELQIEGTVENQYTDDTDEELSVFTTNTSLTDYQTFPYIISGTINTNDNSGYTITQNDQKKDFIFNPEITTLIITALRIDFAINSIYGNNVQYSVAQDENFLKLKVTHATTEASFEVYFVFDVNGQFIGNEATVTSFDGLMFYSVQFKLGE